jgi:hypothetical protein
VELSLTSLIQQTQKVMSLSILLDSLLVTNACQLIAKNNVHIPNATSPCTNELRNTTIKLELNCRSSKSDQNRVCYIPNWCKMGSRGEDASHFLLEEDGIGADEADNECGLRCERERVYSIMNIYCCLLRWMTREG